MDLNDLLKKIYQSSTVDCKPGSAKTRETHTLQNVDPVEELLSSQENAPGTTSSVFVHK